MQLTHAVADPERKGLTAAGVQTARVSGHPSGQQLIMIGLNAWVLSCHEGIECRRSVP
jgi:hypothetical protein